MKLKLSITAKNSFPKEGILITSTSPGVWLHEIQTIGLSLDAVKVFPVPGVKANEVFGCLVVFNPGKVNVTDIGKNNFCQLAENKLFIPENTIIEPRLTKEEWHTLFSEHYHLLHPEIGFVELKDEVLWQDLLQAPVEKDTEILEPSKTISIPQFISSIRYDINPEKILENIEEPFSEEEKTDDLPFDLQKIMNGNQAEMDKFLAFFDKNPELALKMAIPLDTLGTSRGGNDGKFSFDGITYGGGSFRGGGNTMGSDSFDSGSGSIFLKIVFVLFVLASVRSCDLRSTNLGIDSVFVVIVVIAIVALLVALAVSSSSSGSSGGATSGSGNLGSKGSSGSGNSFLVDSERFASLQNRYEKLAESFIEKKEYARAAHIYMKLLKNYYKAAEVLEKGELYNEAAAVHLKYLKNKNKAAECYEKGRAYNQAIELYKEFNNYEKVGDLYLILNNKKEADTYFYKVIESYTNHFQYVKASLVYRNKIQDGKQAQDLLLKGWKENRDGANCLNNYFANIKSVEKASEAITAVYNDTVAETNSELFLQVIKHEFNRHEQLEEVTKNIAYEIVADKIDKKPEIASELIHFNQKNKSMVKDVMRYKLKAKNKYQN